MIDGTVSDCLGWVLYEFVEMSISSGLQCQGRSLKRGSRADTLLGAIRTKVVFKYAEKI